MSDQIIKSVAAKFKATFRRALADVPREPDCPQEYLVGLSELDRLSGGRTDTVESATLILRNLERPLVLLAEMERAMGINGLRKCLAAHKSAIKELKGAGVSITGG